LEVEPEQLSYSTLLFRKPMLFKKSKKSKSLKRHIPVARKSNSRFLELAIVAIFALVAIYAASFVIRITHGYSKTIEGPEYIIRLQILNGCGTNGVASLAAKAIPGLIKLPLEVKIMDIDDFDSYDVDECLIISRDNNIIAAELLAAQLNINSDKIENNYRSISATLVLGKNYRETILKSSQN
jgi:hypothetical protein